jgi:hypothetical protein
MTTVFAVFTGCSAPGDSGPPRTRPPPSATEQSDGEPEPTESAPSGQPSSSNQPGETTSPTSAPSPKPSSTNHAVTDDFVAFQRACEQGANAWRGGQVDYPKTLGVLLGEAATYNAAVDVRDVPLPEQTVIDVPRGKATSEPVAVQCLLAARLTPVDDDIKVADTPEGEWSFREFTPVGVVEWSWSVTATTPADHELRLDLRPAVRLDESPTTPITQLASFTTEVDVKSTALERLAHWFDTQWPLLAGIAAILGAAALAVKRWGANMFSRKAKPKADVASTAPPPSPGNA